MIHAKTFLTGLGIIIKHEPEAEMIIEESQIRIGGGPTSEGYSNQEIGKLGKLGFYEDNDYDMWYFLI